MQHFVRLLLLLVALAAAVSARPEPATQFQNQHPHQVGFVLPASPAPPYGKALPASSSLSSSRHWEWTHWLLDAKAALKSIFGKQSKHHPTSRPVHPDEDRHVGRFDDDIVLRVNISSLADRKAIVAIAESMILDIWSMTHSHIDIRLPKTTTRGFLSLLPGHLTQHEPIITNLRAAVDYTYPAQRTVLPSLQDLLARAPTQAARDAAHDLHALSDLFFANYQSYETVNQWLRLLESLRPELVQVVNVGTSHEGREILGVIIGGTRPAKHAGQGKEEQGEEEQSGRPTPGMVMHGAQHAREWISVSTVCFIAHQMVAGYYVDEKVRRIVDEFDWTFVPILNVDGYEYSWTTDRLWRKNRQPTPVPFCTGIDPDRSWGYMWDAPGSEIFSSNPCSESYRGESPFQAKESELMSHYIHTTLPKRNVLPVGYIDFHSYSQEILYPFAYDCDVMPRDAEDLAEAAWGCAKAARNVHGRYFDVDSACEGDNFASETRIINGGAAVDWAYALGKIRYSFSVKLRDTGNHGFLLPKSEIVPSGEEMFALAKQLGEFILERP